MAMLVSDALYFVEQVGLLLAMAEITASVAFLLLRARRNLGYAAVIAALAATSAGAVLALAIDGVSLCNGVGDCYASDSFETKVYLLCATVLVLGPVLALAPWRRPSVT